MPSPVSALNKIKNMYSPLERAVIAHKLESMPSSQWAAYIKANAPKGAKKEALAVKLDELLARQPKVSKADIVKHIQENSPRINVVEKGDLKLSKEESKELVGLKVKANKYMFGDDSSALTDDEFLRYNTLASRDDNSTVKGLSLKSESYFSSARKAKQKGLWVDELLNNRRGEFYRRRADALKAAPADVNKTRFDTYTLPGGENYKEVILSLPSKVKTGMPEGFQIVEGVDPLTGKSGFYAETPNTRSELYLNKYEAERQLQNYADNVNKANADKENFMVPEAHRYGDPNADINRVAHLRMNDRPTAEGGRALFLEELQSDWGQKGRDIGFKRDLTSDEMTRLGQLDEDYKRLLKEQRQLADSYSDPSVSLTQSRELTKRYGETQNELMDIEREKAKLDAMLYNTTPTGPYVTDTKDWTALGLKKAIERAIEQGHDSLAWTTGAQQAKRYDLSKDINEVHYSGSNLKAYDHDGNEVVSQTGISAEDLPEYIGKDAAEKLLAQQPQGTLRSLTGQDLQIGGEGMKGYYDQIVPSTANDILKSMGVTERVKPIGIQLGGNNVSEQMGFTITPEIRDYVLNQGFPAFAGGGIVESAKKLGRAAKDATSKEFQAHSKYYNNDMMPALLAKYPELGNYRVVGTPLDTAAEVLGAADYGQRVSDYNRALDNAVIYQNMTNSGKNAADNIVQDAEGLALGVCNPLLPKEKLMDAAVRYAKENDYGTMPQYVENPEEYAGGGIVKSLAKKYLTPLSEKEFYKTYVAQHKDIRNVTPEDREAAAKAILESGFHKSMNVNALPIDMGGPATDVIVKRYGNKAGDRVYLLPKEGVIEGGNGLVTAEGYKPTPMQVLDISVDREPSYEAYLRNFTKEYAGGGIVRSGIKDLMDLVSKYKGKYAAQRVERAADEVPNLEQQYTKNALKKAFAGHGDTAHALTIMRPSDFENWAQPLSESFSSNKNYSPDLENFMSHDEYIDYLARIARDSGLSDVPYLQMRKDEVGIPLKPYMTGHEGRHRTRALNKLGDKATLIEVLPYGDLRSGLPRQSQEEYIEALKKELDMQPLVRPEPIYKSLHEDIPREPMIFPKIFKEGGAVHMDEGGLNINATGDYGTYDSANESGSHYKLNTDIDILNKYGFGVTKEGNVVKLPARTYTWSNDGEDFSHTEPARKIKRSDISELRARYMTDDGVQYGVGRQPLAKGWSGYRFDPRSQSTVGVNVSPYYKGINYTKNFAEGGEVEANDVDYDELYEFKKDEPAFAEGGEVDYDALYEFKDDAAGFAKGGPVLSVGRGEKLPVSQGAGLTAKGRARYNKATGSNLKAPAPHPKTEADAGRRKSFCARMSGMPGPMKDEQGRPTRKAASLKRWNCN